MPQLRLPLRPAALPNLRLRRVAPPHSGNGWHGDGSSPLPCHQLGATSGPHPGHERPVAADNTGHYRAGIRAAHQPDSGSPRMSQRPAGAPSEGGSRLGLDPRWVCAATGRRGHRRSPTSHGLKQQAAPLPAQAIGMLQAKISVRSPRSLTGKFRRSAAEDRWEKRTYLLLRNCAPDWAESPAPNTPTRLHIAPQPDQETAQPSQFVWRSRFVETPAFVTGPQSHRGEAS
jgi:hypothetical protein